jgi:hypothetical protein
VLSCVQEDNLVTKKGTSAEPTPAGEVPKPFFNHGGQGCRIISVNKVDSEDGDMSIFHRWAIPLIILSCVFTLTIPSTGYCEDKWVYLGSSEFSTTYYNSPPTIIVKQDNIIKVWLKDIYTEKQKKSFIDRLTANIPTLSHFDVPSSLQALDRQELIDFNYTTSLDVIDYKQRKSYIKRVLLHSKSGKIIYTQELPEKWNDIMPDSIDDILLNNHLKGQISNIHKYDFLMPIGYIIFVIFYLITISRGLLLLSALISPFVLYPLIKYCYTIWKDKLIAPGTRYLYLTILISSVSFLLLFLIVFISFITFLIFNPFTG